MRFANDVNIASFMGDRPEFDRVGAMAVSENAEDYASNAMRNAYLTDAGMRAKSAVERSKANAPAITAAGAAKGSSLIASGFEGLGPVIGKGIRSGFGGLGGGGGITGTEALLSGDAMARGLFDRI